MTHEIYKHVELDGMAERALAEFGADEFLAGKAALDIEAFAEFFLNVTIDYQRLSQDGRTLLSPPQNQVLLPEHLHLP